MTDEQGAWLEATDGKRLPIQGNLSIGRSPKNALVLDSPKISRRHGIVNVQNVGEFWLIDLGSSNGTFLNKRRVHQPVRLSDLDQLIIGDYVFTFRQPIEVTDEYQSTMIERTILQLPLGTSLDLAESAISADMMQSSIMLGTIPIFIWIS